MFVDMRLRASAIRPSRSTAWRKRGARVYSERRVMYIPDAFVCSHTLERLQTLFYSWSSEFPRAKSYNVVGDQPVREQKMGSLGTSKLTIASSRIPMRL